MDVGSLYVWGVMYLGYVYRYFVNIYEGLWIRVNALDTMKYILIGLSGDVWVVLMMNKVYFCVYLCIGLWCVIGVFVFVKCFIFIVNNDKYMVCVDLKIDGSINFNVGYKVVGWLSLSGIMYVMSGFNYFFLNLCYWEYYSGMNGYWLLV